MVIQCKTCETKFKFDESLIEDAGIWVRCSCCKNVFFLDKPGADQGDREAGVEDPPQKPIHLDTESLEKVRAAEEGIEPHIEAINKELGELDRDHLMDEEAEEKPARSQGKQWLFLLVLLLIGSVYLWFFSGIGNQAANFASSAVSTWIERIRGTNLKGEEVGPAQVDLTDIRQRLAVNESLGIIRVVEGTAVNQSTHPMTRIRIKGEIFGDGGVLMGERESYCGNLLTGDEMTSLTEEQIQKELSNPQGSDGSNDRIAPKGKIPFMIVFTREPPGVVNTFVVPTGAERLLP